MKILLVHNYYGSTAPSGENKVFEAERDMLLAHGETVETYTRHSDEIRGKGIWGLVKGALCTIGNPFAAADLKRKIKAFQPDIVHFHNQFPLISPLAIRAAHRCGVKVVMTLHNYRTLCAAGVPTRDGKVCTHCLDKRRVWDALRYRCYRQSLVATLPLALNIALYRKFWMKWVDKFVCLTAFAKEMMISAGFPANKMVVKSNFIEQYQSNETNCPTTRTVSQLSNLRKGVVFAGRLSPEKGVQTLIEAWNLLGDQAPELTIIGDGDCRCEYETRCYSQKVHFVGQKSRAEVLVAVRVAKLVVIPSLCYEGLPTNLIEAYMQGTPCLVSDLGALPGLVGNDTRCVFEAGNEKDLADHVQALWANGDLEALGAKGRATYEANYTEAANARQLLSIYRKILKATET